MEASGAPKLTFLKKFSDITFLSSNVKPLFGFLTSIKSIATKILPATHIYAKNASRKCIKIEI